MTERQRYLETMLFGKPDRIPLYPGGGRKSTMERWHEEGLPKDCDDVNKYAYRLAGGALPWQKGGTGFPVNHRMIPQFEEKVIEKREGTLVVQDWKGNICEISDEYGVEYLRNAIDFVTRRWIKCPVENRDDWQDMKKRYDATLDARFPENAEELGKELAERDHVLSFGVHGPFWQLREWLGFEQLCMLFYDDPAFAEEMIEFWQEYVAALLERVLRYVTPDVFHISEDMAYKQFSMISPAMCRKYLMPVWQRWGEIIRAAGVPIYDCDSDGFIGELIPLWIECGINVCDPIEVAAGNDIVAFRKEFGHDMAYSGGIDKRAIAKGGDVLTAELERIRPVVEDGGFVPGCDHGIPSDVSWQNHLDYVRQLAKLTGWL